MSLAGPKGLKVNIRFVNFHPLCSGSECGKQACGIQISSSGSLVELSSVFFTTFLIFPHLSIYDLA